MLYDSLGLEFCDEVQRTIQASTSREGGSPGARFGGIAPRESGALALKWKQRLSKAEIDRLRADVWDVARDYYTEQDW